MQRSVFYSVTVYHKESMKSLVCIKSVLLIDLLGAEHRIRGPYDTILKGE